MTGPALLFASLLLSLSAQEPSATNYDETRVGSYRLPDPLTTLSGRAVRKPHQWPARRAEILRLFEEYVYGRAPRERLPIPAEVLSTGAGIAGGAGRWREVRLWVTGKRPGPHLDLLLVLPASASQPTPVFVGLNFRGNHAVLDDPGVRVPERWARYNPKGDPKQRGLEASRWQLDRVVRAGYGVATAWYGDLFPDVPDGLPDSVIPSFFKPGQREPAPDEWNAIGAWAWGLSRAVDFLSTQPDVDIRRLAVIGHSRLGKTALWAGALEKRLSIVISNNSGEGGAALSRRNYGETVADLNQRFPHWFNANYKKYSGRAADLPVDQHSLLALIAPRPLYVASAAEDRWADPRGEFLAVKAAEPVYRLLGTTGLGAEDMPGLDQPVMNTLGYHIRTGKHDLTAYDWEQFLKFARLHWGR